MKKERKKRYQNKIIKKFVPSAARPKADLQWRVCRRHTRFSRPLRYTFFGHFLSFFPHPAQYPFFFGRFWPIFLFLQRICLVSLYLRQRTRFFSKKSKFYQKAIFYFKTNNNFLVCFVES